MPFGLHSAPATFQRLLNEILESELEPNVFVYFDDIIIVNQTFEDHFWHLAKVFWLRKARLQLNPEKCFFCWEQQSWAHNRSGRYLNPEKISAIANWLAPTIIHKEGQFIGMAFWYCRFKLIYYRGPDYQTYEKECEVDLERKARKSIPTT